MGIASAATRSRSLVVLRWRIIHQAGHHDNIARAIAKGSCPVRVLGQPTHKVRRALCTELALESTLGIKSWAALLEAMVRHFHPEFDDTEVLQVIIKRTPDQGHQPLRSVFEQAECMEYLDKHDREVLA